jgi:hypothetical protein
LAKITEILSRKELTAAGSLAYGPPDDRLAFLIARINDRIKPPRPATADNVNIRAMYVVNDMVNSHGGRFRREDLLRLCMLIADTPVLIGHNRAGEPQARTFHAELEAKDGVMWLKSFFYWPKSDSIDDFRDKIDSGVFKECSISFTYTFPECSVCGEDFRRCTHELDLLASGKDKPHFVYRGITHVLETSLVFKGSVRGTHMTDRLAMPGDRIIVRSDVNQREISVPPGLSSEHVTIYPLSNRVCEFRVISSPAGVLAATASKSGKPFLMLKLE